MNDDTISKDEERLEELENYNYEIGKRQAYREILRAIMGRLTGADNQLQWALERIEAIIKLREICRDYGDNDWDDADMLPDILDRHLMRYLECSYPIKTSTGNALDE